MEYVLPPVVTVARGRVAAPPDDLDVLEEVEVLSATYLMLDTEPSARLVVTIDPLPDS